MLRSVFALALLCPSVAWSQTVELTWQGRLLDASGLPVNGERSVEMFLFASETGGTHIWTDDFTVPVTDGYLNLALGSGAALPPTLFASGALWAEVHVDDQAVGPRQRLQSVPYAQVAHGVAVVPTNPDSVDCTGLTGSIQYSLEQEALIVCDGTEWKVVGQSSGFQGPSVHNSVPFNPPHVAGGCSYSGTHAYRYEVVGTMDWHSCMVAASQRGAAVQANVYTSTGGGQNGWTGHRNGGSAMYANWSTYASANTGSTRACTLARDPRSAGVITELTSTVEYQGDVWRYQDYGSQHYDQCMLLAANAGASIITPYTIGQSGDGYWVPSVHMCNTYEYISSSGTSYGNENLGSGARSSSRPCMVGYIDSPAP